MTDLQDDSGPREVRARIVGRIGRLIVGGWLVSEVARHYLATDWSYHQRVLTALVALMAFYAGVHWFVVTRIPTINRWLGAAVAVAPVALVYAMGGDPWKTAALTFVGVSLLVDGLFGYGGCEVMSLPGLMFRRRTHLVCIAFSPIDWIEEKIAARRAARV